MYTVTRQQIVDAALTCRGVPFRHQGRDIIHGVDCMGILAVTLIKVFYPRIVDVEGYKGTPPAKVIRETLQANFEEIDISEVGLGDIFLMKIGGGCKPKHASIVVETNTDLPRGIVPSIIHAYAIGNVGRVIVEPLEQWFSKCVVGFRLRGLVEE